MSSSPDSQPPLPEFLDRVSSGTEELPPRQRNRWTAIGAVVVVAIIVVAVIFAAGVLPRAGSSTTTPTFMGAQQAANSAANGYPGGGWSNIAAVAVATVQPVKLNASQIESVVDAANCTVVWAPSVTHTVKVPATPPSAPTGGASTWLFVYAHFASSLLLVVVTNDSAQPLLSASGGICAEVAGLAEPLSSGIVDSSTAVASADASGGTAFLSTHPEANRTWTVIGSLLEPTWTVNYSGCPVPPPPNSTLTAPAYGAEIDADTGTVLTGGNSTMVCLQSLSFKVPPGLPGPSEFGVSPDPFALASPSLFAGPSGRAA